MYWTLTVLSLACLWLAHRLYVLAKIPVPELIKTLNIDIPKASKLSVDNITCSKVHIHWDLPLLEHKIVSFVLYVNGKQASTLNGNVSQCCLSSLFPNTKYKIDLISINSNGYKAKSESIFIKTKPEKLQDYNILLENPENLFRLLTDNPDVSTVHKLTTPSTITSNGEARAAGRSRSNTVNSVNGNGTTAPQTNGLASYAASTATNNSFLPNPKSMDDIEELRYYLESGQEELHTILNQQAQALKDFKEQEYILIEERDKLRDRKKLEDTNRQAIKTEMNLLDDSRRLTELKKSKQESSLIAKRKNIQKMESDLNNWNLKIDEFEKHKNDLTESEDRVHSEIDSDIAIKKSKIKELQDAISKIDEDIKAINSKKKQKEQLKPQFIKIFKTLGDHTDIGGCLDKEGTKTLEQLKSLDIEVHQKIQKEIESDARLEAEWRAQQQREVNNCLRISGVKEALKRENVNLKVALNPSSSHSSTPPSVHSQPSNLVASQIPQHQQNQSSLHQPQQRDISPPNPNAFPFAVPNAFNYNNVQNGSSPSLSSYQVTQNSTPPAFTSSSLWNTFTIPNGSNQGNSSDGFAFNTTLPNNGTLQRPEFEPEVDDSEVLPNAETSAQHLLPKYLIDEDNDFMNLVKGVQGDLSLENSSNSNHFQQGPNSHFGMNNAFSNVHNDSSANLSTKSIFHNEFGIPTQPRFSLDNPSSPPQSFNAELLSNQTSPSNANNNDIHSVFSGNHNELLQNSFQPQPPTQVAQQSSKDTNHISSFSPRRLSNVFSFGRRNNDVNDNQNNNTNEPPASAPSLSKSQQQHSKFFNKNAVTSNANNGDITGTPQSHAHSGSNPLFTFSPEVSNQKNSTPSKFILDSVWKSPGESDNSHNRNVSMNSAHSNNTSFEKEQSFSKFFPGPSVQNNDFLTAPTKESHNNNIGSNVSFSSDAMSDHVNMETGGPIQLSATNKSSNTTSIKSLKSSADNASNVSSSPSFFRKNKFLMNPFGGNNNQANELGNKSPSKQHSTLFRTSSPTKIDAHNTEDSDIEEFHPGSNNNSATTPKRLFSRNRKSSSSNIRKQSFASSHNNDTDSNYNATDGSIQSTNTSASNGKSLVKKFFGKNKGEPKENDLDEQIIEEDIEK